MIMSIQQDVGWLQVQVEQWWIHAVQEVHAHCSLVDDAEAQLPRQWLVGQQGLQGARLHVLHDEALRVVTDPINRQDVSELGRLHLLSLLQQLWTLPVIKKYEITLHLCYMTVMGHCCWVQWVKLFLWSDEAILSKHTAAEMRWKIVSKVNYVVNRMLKCLGSQIFILYFKSDFSLMINLMIMRPRCAHWAVIFDITSVLI